MNVGDLVTRADQLIHKANAVIATQRGDYGQFVDGSLFWELRTGALSFLRATFGEQHPYYRDFDAKTSDAGTYETKMGLGILSAARDELAGGWFISARSLISAEIFADFLDMAGYLLDENYKDAAAVMIGSVLEEHLRQLCQANGVSTEIVALGKRSPKKADTMNADLAKADVYSKLDQKAVTTWLDLRNKAAHGKYTEYTRDQVDIMYRGVTEFMSRVTP